MAETYTPEEIIDLFQKLERSLRRGEWVQDGAFLRDRREGIIFQATKTGDEIVIETLRFALAQAHSTTSLRTLPSLPAPRNPLLPRRLPSVIVTEDNRVVPVGALTKLDDAPDHPPVMLRLHTLHLINKVPFSSKLADPVTAKTQQCIGETVNRWGKALPLMRWTTPARRKVLHGLVRMLLEEKRVLLRKADEESD